MVDAASAPCKENKWFGDDIDLYKFPTPLGHRGDRHRYIQQADINICRTPDGKWTNWSTNRGMIHDKNTMTGLWLHGTQHKGGEGHAFRDRAWRGPGRGDTGRVASPRLGGRV
jgi:UbiD family decarboxylase